MPAGSHSTERERSPAARGSRWYAGVAVSVAALIALVAVFIGQSTGNSSPIGGSGEPTPTGSSDGSGTAASGPDVTTPAGYLIIDGPQLAALPTSGPEWESMLSVATESLGTPDLADQDSTVAGQTVAAALVYARTGDDAYRDRVITVLTEAEQAPLAYARVLSVARQLAGFVIAADLVDYRDDSFESWVDDMRTQTFGGHSRWFQITQTSENSANNWGSWALASRIAASAYLGDTKDLDRASQVFRGLMGESDAYAGFQPTEDFDPSWACDPENWVPVNPAGCGELSGAPVEDVSRSGGSAPTIDSTGVTYAWEFLGGATLSARVLAHSGYPSVYAWGDQALLRAGRFLADNGGYPAPDSVNQYIPWEIDSAYDVSLGPVNAAGFGRQFGFTDWLSASPPT